MKRFLSELSYGSFLIYPSPRAGTRAEEKAKAFILALKRDRVVDAGPLTTLIVDQLAAIVRDSPLANYFDGTATLVPMPTHGLMKRNSVWASRSLANAMVAHGLAADTVCCIRRTKPIRKSAQSSRGARPTPQEHYETMEAQRAVWDHDVTNIVMIDDVVTRGATLSGAGAHLQEAFPGARIRAFALARTDALTRWRDPHVGTIHTPVDGSRVSRR